MRLVITPLYSKYAFTKCVSCFRPTKVRVFAHGSNQTTIRDWDYKKRIMLDMKDAKIVHLWFHGLRVNYAGQPCHTRICTMDIRITKRPTDQNQKDGHKANIKSWSIRRVKAVMNLRVETGPGYTVSSWYAGPTKEIAQYMSKMRSTYSSYDMSVASAAIPGFVAWYTPGIYAPCGIGRVSFRLYVDYARRDNGYNPETLSELVMWWFRLAKYHMSLIRYLPKKGDAYKLELYVFWITRINRMQSYIDDSYASDQCTFSINEPTGLSIASGDCEDRTMNALHCSALIQRADLMPGTEAAMLRNWISKHFEVVMTQGVVRSSVRSLEFHVFAMIMPKKMIADFLREKRHNTYLPTALVEPNQTYQAVWKDAKISRSELTKFEQRPRRRDENVVSMIPTHVLIKRGYYISTNTITLSSRQARLYGTHKIILSTKLTTLGGSTRDILLGKISHIRGHRLPEPKTVKAQVDERLRWLPPIIKMKAPSKRTIPTHKGTYVLFYRQRDYKRRKQSILTKLRRQGYSYKISTYSITDTFPIVHISLT